MTSPPASFGPPLEDDVELALDVLLLLEVLEALPSGTPRPPPSLPPLLLPPLLELSSGAVDESAHAASAATAPVKETRTNTPVVSSFDAMEHPYKLVLLIAQKPSRARLKGDTLAACPASSARGVTLAAV
jgi:hypothetical protein